MSECGGSVASIKIAYYVVIHGRGYWRPSRKLKKLGFQDVRCGEDGPAAWSIADTWNKRVAATLRGEQPPPIDITKLSKDEAEAVRRYPPRSVGAAFQAFIRTDEWKRLALSSRMKLDASCARRLRSLRFSFR